MIDLIEKARQRGDWTKFSNSPENNRATHRAEADDYFVPFADVCQSCIVPGGCDDLDPRCQLAARHHIRADSRNIKPSDRRYKIISTDRRC